MAKLVIVHDDSGEEILINADRIVMVENVKVTPTSSGAITMTLAGGHALQIKEDFRQLQALVNA